MSNDSEKDIDLEFEADAEQGTPADFADKLKKLKEKLKECQKEKQEYLNGWQRERADFQNYKKDENKRRADYLNFAKEKFALEILPVLDSYDMAFQNKEAWEKVDKSWRVGVEYIHHQILNVLAGYDVLPIKTKIGDVFDPALHQSIETIETKEKEKDHRIAAITQTGYKIGEKVLRPARVNVFGYKE